MSNGVNGDIIQIRDLCKTYRVGKVDVPALRGVDLDVEKGHFLSIIGPSGSGKSTLFHIIGGLTPPTTGKVVVDDKDLSAMTDAERTRMRKRTVGFVFQKFNLLPNLTARDNIAVARYIGGTRREAGARVRGGAAPARHRGPAGSQTECALRRRAAARGDCAGDCESPGDFIGRRAHGESGHGEFEGRAGGSARSEPAAGADHSDDHAQSGGRGLRRFHGPHAGRPDHGADV